MAYRAELDSGTAFHFVQTLVVLGYVERIPDSKQFRLTLKPLELGFHAIAQNPKFFSSGSGIDNDPQGLKSVRYPNCLRTIVRLPNFSIKRSDQCLKNLKRAEVAAQRHQSEKHSPVPGEGFRVLQAFTAEDPELKLSEVARRAGLDNGTAFRLLETLVMLGYLERLLETKQYRLTLKPLDLGFNAIARMDLRTIAQPELRTLVGEVREAASIGILDRDEVVYIERYQEGQARLGVDIRVGSRLPAYCTAIGHSILAFLPRAERRRILGLTRRVKVNDHTPVTLEEIEEKLEEARATGYAISELRIHRRATRLVRSHFRRGRLRYRCPERRCTLPAHAYQGICGAYCRASDRVSGKNRACACLLPEIR